MSAIWLVPNWVIATLSGLTPDSVRITRSKVTLAWVRPITPTRCPARSPIPLIFGAGGFFEPLAGRPATRPQHHDVLAQDGDRLGIGRHFQIAARNREVGLLRRQQRDAFGRALGRDRLQPDRAAVAGKGLRQRLHQFLVVASGRADRDPQGHRPQRRNTGRPRPRQTARARRPAPAAHRSCAFGAGERSLRLGSGLMTDMVLSRYTKKARKRLEKEWLRVHDVTRLKYPWPNVGN